MGSYSKELMKRFRENRDAAPLSEKAKAVRKQASKRDRVIEQRRAIIQNTRRVPYRLKSNKADTQENWRHEASTSRANRARNLAALLRAAK